MDTSPNDSVVLVPIQLQAFVLNDKVANEAGDSNSRIIPITQPNYTFLRLDNFLIQSDVLGHSDLHNAAPAATNMRLTDLGDQPHPSRRRNRYGVYLHWILPDMYRSGVVAADSVKEERHDKERERLGLPPRTKQPSKDSGDKRNTDTPEYLQPPTRWIIIRRLHRDSVKDELMKYFNEYEAWVLESDYKWDLDDIPVTFDLQTDVSPFVVGQKGEGVDIEQQAEVFIGRRTPLADYQPGNPSSYTDISLLKSGNMFFADFQLHNSNVFSIVDNFKYLDEDDKKRLARGDDGAPPPKPSQGHYLDSATADYYLVGWHSSDSTDPLLDKDGKFTHADKLRAIYMELKDTGTSEVKTFLGGSSNVRMCLHGALYDVHWDMNTKPETPADKFSATLHDDSLPSTAVGTSPIDALMTYVAARKHKETDKDVERLEEDILAIDSLLHARDDGVEGQREAKDMVYNWNFSRFPGGKHYFIAGQDSKGKPTQPDPKAVELLAGLNINQQLLDACARSAEQYRWDMFSIWWKYVTDQTNFANRNNDPYERQATDLAEKLTKLQERMKQLDAAMVEIKKEMEENGLLLNGPNDLKTSTLPFYFQHRDPTVLLGGVESGWPSDFNDSGKARLPSQCVTKTGIPPDVRDLAAQVTSKFPGQSALSAVEILLDEFWTLMPSNTPDDAAPEKEHVFPQFHDKLSSTNDNKYWRDRWENRQPWFPLYVEWAVEYTHVPFEYWDLSGQAVRISAPEKIRYGVPGVDADGKPATPLWKKMKTGTPAASGDTCLLSGRVLILPQPSFSLAAKVNQLFDNTPPSILKEYLGDDERTWVKEHLSKLAFLSCPLNGFTEGLLTLSAGTHIKPENKFITSDGLQSTTAIQAAQFPAAGLTKEHIEMIQNNSALTPYSVQNDYTKKDFCPFKPVTHGQFRFTKFNVIDKFGQALVAIDPKPLAGPRQHPPIYPAISDFYQPQTVTVDGKTQANTVLQNDGPRCEFVQLPPQINQAARLNADFVVRQRNLDDKGEEIAPRPDIFSSYWRPVDEWENPIWGWLVINYADQGIQIFLADGTFYREVRVGGRDGAIAEPKWLPFACDDNVPEPGGGGGDPNKKPPTVKDNKQLDELVEKMKDANYLRGLWIMISTAINNMAPSPSAYSQFLGSIVGKPLALVNMGISLELEKPALVNQSTKTSVMSATPERYLLAADAPPPAPSYEFQVKLGDKAREADGLVGYFKTIAEPTVNDNEKELVLEDVYTYFFNEDGKKTAPPPGIKNLVPIDNEPDTSYPKLKPFWVAPFPHSGGHYDGKTRPYISPQQYRDLRNNEMKVYGAILDPFTPIHAFSSFLPAKSLQLPSWTWQDAMQNMVAFFHAGPLNVVKDVGDFVKDDLLTTKSMKDAPKRNVAIPSLGVGDWNWLQPFDIEGDELPSYNPYGIERKGNPMAPGFEKAPYTAIEGFLQLRRPIMVEKPADDTKTD